MSNRRQLHFNAFLMGAGHHGAAWRRPESPLGQLGDITYGAIITRVWADVEAVHDRFVGLSRIGIDEISYKRGHKYLTVVVDHDSGRLVWAAPGRDKATLAGSSTHRAAAASRRPGRAGPRL